MNTTILSNILTDIQQLEQHLKELLEDELRTQYPVQRSAIQPVQPATPAPEPKKEYTREPTGKKCPKCGKDLTLIRCYQSGELQYSFVGCAGYPDCTYHVYAKDWHDAAPQDNATAHNPEDDIPF